MEEAPPDSSSLSESNGRENSRKEVELTANNEVPVTAECVLAADCKDIKIVGEDEDELSLSEDVVDSSGGQSDPKAEQIIICNSLAGTPKEYSNGSTVEAELNAFHQSETSDINSVDDNEDYCNPMVSDSEEDIGEDDIVLRGDRIGSTTYSERHLLKLLMKLVQELPRYTLPSNSENPVDNDKEDIKLEKDFEEEMSLLWDMSAEPDVMAYLVDRDIFTIIRDTMQLSKSMRLTEVALGIMANLLSQKTIVEDFHVYDAKLELVAKVINQLSKVTNVAVLIQIFAVLKRIVWFIKNVKIVDEWIVLFLNDDFFQYANFIMASSTNLLLLGDVITTMYSLLEAFCAESVDKEQKEGDNPAEESLTERSSRENCRKFCDTAFVSSICEGLNELLKNPKPKVSKNVEAFTGGEQNSDFDVDIPIPDGHVQTAILNGLSALAYLEKNSWAHHVLNEQKDEIIGFLLTFLNKFSQCTDNQPNSNCVEYFALSVGLLGFCHKNLSKLCEEAVVVPISTAFQVILNEQDNRDEENRFVIRMKSGLDFDSVTYIALEMHNYLTSITEEFGQDCIADLRKQEKYKKFFGIMDETVTTVCDANESFVMQDKLCE